MNARLRMALAASLMIASGFAGLAYQVVWVQQSSLWLGQESAAVIAVVTAFFGGLALGAAVLGKRIERSVRPVRWYIACELTIGLWALILTLWLAPLTNLLLHLTGHAPSPLRQWLVCFGGTFIVLLPATMSMGATLPAMERAQLPGGKRALSALYAANTLGAMLGVLCTAFWLLPGFGLTRTVAVCVALNFVCAAAACALSVRAKPSAMAASSMRLTALALLMTTGLLGIGYEIIIVRALSQLTENTVYTFALLLAFYLAGTALGAAAYSRWLAHRDAAALRDRLLQWLALVCLFGLLALSSVHASTLTTLSREAWLAGLLFLAPTLLMGALFSHLITGARSAGLSPGQAIAANTFGAALAPPLFGLALIPLFALKVALLLLAAGYLILVSRRAWMRPAQWGAAAAISLALLALPPLRIVTIPEGGRLIRYTEGAMSSVAVVADAADVLTLRINNRQQEGSTITGFADGRQALLPLLLHTDPRSALFLGVGTGITAGSATLLPHLNVEAVELAPEVIDNLPLFASALPEGADP
ncbi:MAG: spermidine synthase, partial [Nevskiaceae bacterium]|nr:spermidine synthase [Nevskiaceae bacterium]